MQSNKPSKKTPKAAAQKPPVKPEAAAAETAAKPHVVRSSRTKKSELTETSAVKHHHKTASIIVPESAVEPSQAATPSLPSVPSRKLSQAAIAELAYSYWVERNYRPGSPEEDWLRAERELLGVG